MSSEKIANKRISSGWAMAARDARRQIEQAKIRIASLQKSLKISEQKARDGEPWPGEKQNATPLRRATQLNRHRLKQQHNV
jgi:hypothetical protein